MLKTLLIIHVIVSILLIMVILLQKTSVDGAHTLSGSNMNLIGVGAANNFLLQTTVVLAIIFAVVLISTGNIISQTNQKRLKSDEKIEMQ